MANSNGHLLKTLEHNNRVDSRFKNSNMSRSNNIDMTGYGSKVDAVNTLLKSNNSVVSTVGKALTADGVDKTKRWDDIYNDNKNIVSNIVEKIVNRRANNKEIFTLFPETRLQVEILIAYILSPGKMIESELRYSLKGTFLEESPTFKSSLMSFIEDSLEEKYKLAENLPDLLTDILSFDGYAPYMVLSEAVTDDIINSDLTHDLSLESFKTEVSKVKDRLTRNILLDNPKEREESKSLEEVKDVNDLVKYMVSNESVDVTDNGGIFHINRVKNAIRSNVIRNSMRGDISVSMEAKEKISYLDIFRDRKTTSQYTPTVMVHDRKQATRKTIGKAMNKRLPAEAVFGIPSPGNKDEHLGYLVILDANTGNPITETSSQTVFDKLNNNMGQGDYSNSPITKVYKDMVNTGDENCLDMDKVFELYKSMLEKKIYDCYKDTIYGEDITIPDVENFYYVMFTRALQAQRTSILFVPRENMVYYSVLRNELGIGKTILDDLEVLYSMRSILLFAKIMAYTRNAIPITEVGVDLDPEDPNPEATMDKISNQVLQLRRNDLPLGQNRATMLLDWIQKLGLVYKWRNHPGIPEMSIDFTTSNINYDIPDSEFDDGLRKQAITGTYISPEVIDAAYSPDFAVQALNNNVLLNKRTANMQKNINPELTKHGSMLIYNDGELRDGIKALIKEAYGEIDPTLTEKEKALKDKSEEDFLDYYVDKISNNIIIELPKLTQDNTEQLMDDFNKYRDTIKEVLESVYSDDMLSEEESGIIKDKVGMLRETIISICCKKWAADHNFLPELFSMLGTDDDIINTNVSNAKETYVSMVKNFIKMAQSQIDIKKASQKDIDVINAASEVEEDDDEY